MQDKSGIMHHDTKATCNAASFDDKIRLKFKKPFLPQKAAADYKIRGFYV